jgi:hypothetical protein
MAGRIWRGAVSFWPTWVLFSLAIPVALVRQALRDQPIRELLGAYAGVTNTDYRVADVVHWALYHLAALDIFVGVFPFAALVLLAVWGLRPAAPRELRILSAVGVSTLLSFLVVVAAFATTPTVTRILERNLFHVVPIFFLALTAWIAAGAPRPWWALAPAALFAGSLTLALPINSFLNSTAVHSTPSLLPLWRWRDRAFSPESIDDLVAAGAIVGALLFTVVPRRFTPLFIGVLVVYFAAASRPVETFTHKASVDAFMTIGSPRDWVDRAVGRDANVGSFYWAGDQFRFWETEFFNRSVGTVYSVPGPYDGLGQVHVAVEPSGLVRGSGGVPVSSHYALTDIDTRLAGKLVAANPVGMVLYEIGGRLIVRERIDGLYSDRWSGSQVYYTRFGCRGGTLVVRLTSQPPIHPRAVTMVVDQSGAQQRVRIPRAADARPVRIRLVPGRTCVVGFRMPTGSATAATPDDLRELGLRFDSFRYVSRR